MTLTSVLDWLNLNARYFVAWGYENLPEHTGGDIDICVHPDDFDAVAAELKRRHYTCSRCPRFGISHAHAHFSKHNETTLDIFTTFCFAYEGKTVVLNINPFICQPVVTGKPYFIASPMTEALFTSLRVLGGRKDCVERLAKYLLY